MSFLNKFQYHYHDKQIESLVKSKNYKGLFSYLESISDKKKIFHDLSLKNVSQAINQSSQDISKNKIVWINSFLSEDSDYFSLFFEYYLQNFELLKQKITSYKKAISEILLKAENVDFNTLVNQSYFFQWMILNNKEKRLYKFISNDLPFFSTENNFNFSKSNLSQSFIFIINHPYRIYQKIKKSNNNDQEIAKNIFLNLDNQASSEEIGKTNFSISRKGWHVHSQSWLDANVINSLRGKIISIKELSKEPYETLSSVILHLIQSGVKIDLNYDLIENFIKEYPVPKDEAYEDLSNKEIKFLDKYVNEIMGLYDI